ncbi:Sac2 family-domain-containing protein [Lineolata rhizophorae]|uniref:Sac2 family-domain-containing protein n=1 Tax=Lineolata rhizophorae TaxID=578093 RepID=A0A6A6NX17_9PEZI|nr:Sac2 family-domain-containing protein [Lineolata rhizophorae]
MWLDRFTPSSSQASPAATPRSFSPAPRRGPYLAPDANATTSASRGAAPQRPSFGPRSSSLSLVSNNSSTTSLPGAAAGRQSISGGPSQRRPAAAGGEAVGVPDPVAVLEGIMGRPPRGKKEGGGEKIERPERLVEEIDFKGLSLTEFVDTEGKDGKAAAPKARDVHRYSVQSVEEYDKEKDKFEDLHKSILACDDVLKSVETYLTGFQADLGAVSAEIETLQTRSSALNTKLENRKVVEKLLGPAVEDVGVAPAVVYKIAEGPIDDSWPVALLELEKKVKAIEAKEKERNEIKAIDDLKPLLENLTNKAIERIRDFLIAQIKALRSPNINAQIIQQTGFLKYKDLFAFLARRHPQLAGEIAQAYANTMRWYYAAHFVRYQKALDKLRIHHIDRHDAIANFDESGRRLAGGGGSSGASGSGAAGLLGLGGGGAFGGLGGSGGVAGGGHTGGTPHDAFVLGRRINVLRDPPTAALTAYVADEDTSAHYLEVPFQSFNLALIDNASFEYTFLSSFFSPLYPSASALGRLFTSIFDPAFALGKALTARLTAEPPHSPPQDALGFLLAIRINQRLQFALQRRRVPAADAYTNATNLLLWPRFSQVLDLHVDSVRRAAAALPARPPGVGSAAAALVGAAAPGSSTGGGAGGDPAASTAPLPLTQRFAHFAASVLTVAAESAGAAGGGGGGGGGGEEEEEPVGRGLARLRDEVERYLNRVAAGMRDRRKRDRFLANNYALVGTILEGVPGRTAGEWRVWCEGVRGAAEGG